MKTLSNYINEQLIEEAKLSFFKKAKEEFHKWINKNNKDEKFGYFAIENGLPWVVMGTELESNPQFCNEVASMTEQIMSKLTDYIEEKFKNNIKFVRTLPYEIESWNEIESLDRKLMYRIIYRHNFETPEEEYNFYQFVIHKFTELCSAEGATKVYPDTMNGRVIFAKDTDNNFDADIYNEYNAEFIIKSIYLYMTIYFESNKSRKGREASRSWRGL